MELFFVDQALKFEIAFLLTATYHSLFMQRQPRKTASMKKRITVEKR